jgi:hypothetical protein
MTVHGSQVSGTLPVRGLRVSVSPSGEQDSDDVAVSMSRCVMQRRPAVAIGGIHVQPQADQLSDRFDLVGLTGESVPHRAGSDPTSPRVARPLAQERSGSP